MLACPSYTAYLAPAASAGGGAHMVRALWRRQAGAVGRLVLPWRLEP